MSDNKNHTTGGKSRDTFAKPGDESISSGKGFLIAFPKLKRNSSNPLLESEKNKNAKRSDSAKNAEDRPSENKSESGKGGRFGKRRPEKNGADRQDNGGEKNERQQKTGLFGHRPNKGQKDGRDAAKDDSQTRSQSAAAPSQDDRRQENRQQENTGAGRRDRRHGRHGKNNNHPENAKQENGRQENAKPRQENGRKNAPNDADRRATDRNKGGAPANNNKNDRNERNERNDRSRQRPKHKKEKFVPTATDYDEGQTLAQPIVDRTGILSGGRTGSVLRTSGSILSRGTDKTPLTAEEEPRYIDRDRPLAEQIAEQSKPKVYRTVDENAEMTEVIGVRFREAGKVYYFDPNGQTVPRGTPVIVETARGVEYGFCAIANRRVPASEIVPPLKAIQRVATRRDTERYERNREMEVGAAKIFREKARALKLEMSLVYVEYTFDNSKLLFYFTAEGRVDFRELIKELAAAFHTRIELRQIGVRDEAKIIGGLGLCGRPVCCSSFLGEFAQVSVKMAKDQNLFINSSKISGTCGRYMCCIRYEDEVYQKEYERTPKIDTVVETPQGRGIVVESNILKGAVKVLLDEQKDALPVAFKSEEVKVIGRRKKGGGITLDEPAGEEAPADAQNDAPNDVPNDVPLDAPEE